MKFGRFLEITLDLECLIKNALLISSGMHGGYHVI